MGFFVSPYVSFAVPIMYNLSPDFEIIKLVVNIAKVVVAV